MVQTFLTIRAYSTLNEAKELMHLLEVHNIEHVLEDNSKVFDPSFALNSLDKVFDVKVAANDFEKVEQLLHFEAQENIAEIEADHYLHEFTSVELLKLLHEPDLWGEYDYVAAQLILRKRGMVLPETNLKTWRIQRNEDLAKPESASNALKITGYLGACFAGFLGFIIGYQLAIQKKVLPNGKSVQMYDSRSQKAGRLILVTSTLSLITYILATIYILSQEY